MRAADVRVPHARTFVIAAAVIACAAILWLARGFTFYFDEWTFILPMDPSWTVVLQPHNEHPVMLTRLIYAVLLNSVGMRSYLPYMIVLLALHMASVVLLFELVRRRAGDVVAIGAAMLLLLLGAGWENLLWAFQIAFVGSVACGLAALLVMEAGPPNQSEPPHPGEARDASLAGPPRVAGRRDRMWIAMLLLLASLMFSGIGLFFVVAAAIWLALTPSRRKDLVWLVPIAFLFVLWYLTYGHTGTPPKPVSIAGNLAALPLYLVWGLGASVAGLIGEGGGFGPVLLLIALVAIGLTWRRRRPDGFSIGIACALVVFYLVLGLNRGQIGYQQSGAGRYVYEGAVFWLLLLADAARELPWRGTWRPALIACLFLACFSSSALLYEWAVAKTEQMQREVADLYALTALRSDPCLSASASPDPLVMPQVNNPAVYYRATDLYGDPRVGLPLQDNPGFAAAFRNLVKPDCVRP